MRGWTPPRCTFSDKYTDCRLINKLHGVLLEDATEFEPLLQDLLLDRHDLDGFSVGKRAVLEPE